MPCRVPPDLWLPSLRPTATGTNPRAPPLPRDLADVLHYFLPELDEVREGEAETLERARAEGARRAAEGDLDAARTAAKIPTHCDTQAIPLQGPDCRLRR